MKFKYDGRNPLATLHPGEPWLLLRAADAATLWTVMRYSGYLAATGDAAGSRQVRMLGDAITDWRRGSAVQANLGSGLFINEGEHPMRKLLQHEPWFFLRAQDRLSFAAATDYALRLKFFSSPNLAARSVAEAFQTWQQANPEKVKKPD